jgi:hypothetical protein
MSAHKHSKSTRRWSLRRQVASLGRQVASYFRQSLTGASGRGPRSARSGQTPKGIAVDVRSGGHRYPSPPAKSHVPFDWLHYQHDDLIVIAARLFLRRGVGDAAREERRPCLRVVQDEQERSVEPESRVARPGSPASAVLTPTTVATSCVGKDGIDARTARASTAVTALLPAYSSR